MKLSERPDPKGTSSGNYARLFDSDKLGRVVTKVHSAAINAGHDLEDALAKLVKPVVSLDYFLDVFPEQVEDGVYLANKGQIKRCARLKPEGGEKRHEPDLLVFIKRAGARVWIIELKVGHAFDTKKVDGELASLRALLSLVGQKVAAHVSGAICCFFMEDTDEIFRGLKGKVPKDMILTGYELCVLLGIEEHYADIQSMPRRDGLANRQWLLEKVQEATKDDPGTDCASKEPELGL